MEIYTDGSSLGNPGKGGYGAIIVTNDQVYEVIGSENNTTNNRMELLGAIAGISQASKLEKSDKIKVFTDSSYVEKGVTFWVKNWIKNGWKTKEGKDVLNKDLWEKLSLLVSKNKVKFEKVSGHSGDVYNERADDLAVMASSGIKGKIYFGENLDEYIFAIKDSVKDKKKKSPKSEKAYGYVSMIGKEILFHTEWSECKKRVEGKKAKFKKVLSEQEKNDLIGRWTMESIL